MATSAVSLPICALKIDPVCHADGAAADHGPILSEELEQFLESLRPGWATRFARAFLAAAVTFEDLESLSSTRRELLEEEMLKAGAKLLHMKILRNALDAKLTCPLTCKRGPKPCVRNPSVCIQSPLAAYFDENCFNVLPKDSPAGVVLKDKSLRFAEDGSDKDMASMPSSPLNGISVCDDENPASKSPLRKHNGDDFACSFNDCGVSTNCLPYKSPMTAYFDGNDCFCLEYDACQASNMPVRVAAESRIEAPIDATDDVNRKESLGKHIISNSSVSGNGGIPGICVLQLVQPATYPAPCFSQCPQHGDATVCGKQRRVRWADEEMDERRPLKLAELVETPAPNVSRATTGRVWQMAQDKDGCREVQKALDELTDKWAIASELIGHVWEAMRCPHANHVLRKVIQTLSPACLHFVIREIVQRGPAGVREAASHRFGCRILEELLRVCDAEQINDMVEALIGDVEALCTHMYGNFVVNTLLSHCSPTQYHRIMHTLVDHVAAVGTNFYGCAVLAHALKGSNHESRLLTLALLSVSGLLSSMNSHKHGKAVVEVLMGELRGDECEAAIAQLALPPLKTSKSAKSCRSHMSR